MENSCIIRVNIPILIVLDYESGELQKINKPVDDNINLYHSFGTQLINDYLYFFKYIEPGHYSFYKYDFKQDLGQELIDLGQYNLDYSVNRKSYYDEHHQLFYVELILEKNGEASSQIILTIDRESHDTSVIYREDISSNASLRLYNKLIIKDNVLVTGKNNQGVIGMDISSGSIIWINEEVGYVRDVFEYNDHVYVADGLDLYQIDHNSGSTNWHSPGFSSFSTYDVVKNSDMMVTVAKNIFPNYTSEKVITIYDMHTGQRLMEDETDHSNGIINVNEASETNTIYEATSSYLYKYSWPF